MGDRVVRHAFLLAAALTGIAALPASASATTVYLEANAVAPYPIGDFLLGGAIWYGAGITQYRYTGNYVPGGEPAEFLGYCIDFLAPVNSGLYEITGLDRVFDPAKGALLTTLLGNVTALEAAAADADKLLIRTATQLAIWELVEETSGSFGLDTGAFQALDAVGWPPLTEARALAGAYLFSAVNEWAPIAGVRAQLLYDDELQSAVFLSAVPEPASWALMIGGVGAIGGAARRRRVRVAYA